MGELKHSERRALIAALIGALAAASMSFDTLAGEQADCETTREATVSMRAPYPEDAEYGSVREQLLRDIGSEAVRQATGLTIRSYVSAKSEMHKDSFDETLLDRMLEKSAGRLAGYQVLKEEILPAQGQNDRYLEVEVRAQVCAPPPEGIPEIIAVKGIVDVDGQTLASRRSLILDAVPEMNAMLLSPDLPSEGYHDIAIAGRVERIEENIVDNTAKKAMMGAYVPAQTLSTIPDQVRRITVVVSMTADLIGKGRQLTESETLFEDIPLDASASSIQDALIDESIQQVSAKLFARLARVVK